MPDKFRDLQDRLPNLPIFAWISMKDLKSDGNKSCSKYPNILNIEYRNKYWQIFKTYDENNTREATYHLYGAYLGNNQISISSMIILIHRQQNPFDQWSCHKNSCYGIKQVKLLDIHISIIIMQILSGRSPP